MTPKLLLAVRDADRLADTRRWCKAIGYPEEALTNVATDADVHQAIHAGTYDAYLLDLALTDDHGNAWLALAHKAGCRAPLLLLADEPQEALTLQLLRRGAADVLTWHTLDATALERALQQALARAQAVVANAQDFTRRRTEDALRASEALTRALLNALPDAMLRISADGTHLAYTAPPEFAWSIPPDMLLGKRPDDVLPPDLGRQIMQARVRALETGTVQTVDYGVEIDGTTRFREARLIAYGNNEVIVIVRDFTAWKRTEHRLRESESKFRDLFENSPDAIFVEDMHGEVLDANAAAGRLHNCKAEDLIGKNMRDLVPPDHREAALETFRRMTTGQIDYLEAHSWTADGQRLPVEIRARRIIYDRRPALLLHVRDIAERKQAEEALHRSEAQNRALLDALPDALVRLSREGVYLDVRLPRDYDAYVDPNQLVGQSAYALLPPEVARRARACTMRALETGQVQTFEYDIQAGGSIHVREARVVPCGDDEVISIQRDITERKRAERELKRSREQLRELARHLQSVREAERTRISREVHDQLGQALTALRMDVAWIEKNTRSDQDALPQRLDAMKALIDQTVHTVRRIASELRPGLLDDLGLAPALEWQTQEFASRTNLHCTFTNDTNLPALDPDLATTVFRVFQELLTNVARHAEASCIDITLRSEDGHLVLVVQDDGRGIADLDLVHTNSLGMLGMRERTQAWGGTLHFASAPGQGTTATVCIPLPTWTETEPSV